MPSLSSSDLTILQTGPNSTALQSKFPSLLMADRVVLVKKQLLHLPFGLLVHWFIDSLVHWFIGSLVHWFIGSLVHWFLPLTLLHNAQSLPF